MKNQRSGRAKWLAGAAAIGFSACGAADALAESAIAPSPSGIERELRLNEYLFEHDGVLGTSMELIVESTKSAEARECERQVSAEIERLRQILSTYDAASEIRGVMKGGSVKSAELAEVLAAYEWWNARTRGAINVNMAEIIQLWKTAATCGQLPARAELEHGIDQPFALNIDALGKGFIIDRAVAVARRIAPGGLLNIGGDIRTWGRRQWLVGIADSTQAADNAPPLRTLSLRDSAIATSGGYARFFTIADERYSHLIDPRTLWPIDRQASASVIAADCLTANALSTAACVLDKSDGAELANEYGNGHLIVSKRGLCDGLADFNANTGNAINVAAQAPLAAAAATAWPKDFQVSLDLILKAARGGKVKRSYVAVWVEDAKGKTVRTITVWGTQPKYLREMTEWWRVINGDQKIIRSVSRATRDAGKYTIMWDGLDDAGVPLPKGDYTLKVEINREHGRHVGEMVQLSCKDKKVATSLKATAESDESPVEYGPKAN
jgi:thiamine biosynthesis lipoprotein